MGTTCAKGVNGAVSPSHTTITVQEYSNNNNNKKKNSSNNSNNNKKGVVRIRDKNALYKGTTTNTTTNTTSTPITHVHAKLGTMAFIEEEDTLSVPSVHITPASSRMESPPPLISLTLSKQQLQGKNTIHIFPHDTGVKKRREVVSAYPAMMSENDMTAAFNRREWMQRRRTGNIATNTNTNNNNNTTTTTKKKDSITVITSTPTISTKVTKVPSKQFVDVGNEYQRSIVDDTCTSSSSSSSSTTTSTENFTEFSTSVPLMEKTKGISLSSPHSTRRLPQFTNSTVRRSGSMQYISPVMTNTAEERKRGISTVKSRGSGSEVSVVPSRRRNNATSRLLPPNLVPSPSAVEQIVETNNVKGQQEREKEKVLPQLTSESKCSGKGNTQMESLTALDDVRLFTLGDSNEGTLHTALSFQQRSSPDTVTSGEEILPLTSETIPTTRQSISTEQTLPKRGIGNIFPIESPLEVVKEKEQEKLKGENGLLDSSYAVNGSHFSKEEMEREEEEEEEEENKKKKEEWSSVNSVNKSSSMEIKKKDEKKKIDISLDSQRRRIEEEEAAERARKREKYNEVNNNQKGNGNSHYISRSLPRSKSCEGFVISPPVIQTDNVLLRSFSYQRPVDESPNTSRNMEFSSLNSHFTVNKRQPGRLSNQLLSPSPLVSPQPLSSITRTSAMKRISPTGTEKRENNEKNCLVQYCRSISPPPHQPMNVFPSQHRRIYSPAMEPISRTTTTTTTNTNTTGGSFGLTTTRTTTTTLSRDRVLMKRGAKYICQWCGGPYELYEICRIKLEPHASIRQQRKYEKEVKKHAQALLRSGRVQEAVIELQRARLI